MKNKNNSFHGPRWLGKCQFNGRTPYHQLTQEMHESLLRFALQATPEFRKSEAYTLNMHRETKLRGKAAP